MLLRSRDFYTFPVFQIPSTIDRTHTQHRKRAKKIKKKITPKKKKKSNNVYIHCEKERNYFDFIFVHLVIAPSFRFMTWFCIWSTRTISRWMTLVITLNSLFYFFFIFIFWVRFYTSLFYILQNKLCRQIAGGCAFGREMGLRITWLDLFVHKKYSTYYSTLDSTIYNWVWYAVGWSYIMCTLHLSIHLSVLTIIILQPYYLQTMN